MLAVAVTVQGAVSFVELGVPVLAVYIGDDLGLTAVQLGLIVTALNLGRLIGFLPAGHVADHRGERVVLIASGAGVALCTVASALVPFLPLLVALAATGFFSGAATPAGSRLVLEAFPPQRRALMLGIRQASIPLAGMAAAVALPFLADPFGWRWALALAAAVPLAGTLVAVLARGRGTQEQRRVTRVFAPEAARHIPQIVRDRRIVLAGSWSMLFIGGQYALLTYFTPYLEQLGHSRSTAFSLLAVANGMGVVGRLAWGWLSDRQAARGRRAGLLGLTVFGGLAAGVLAITPAGGSLVLPVVAATVGGACLIGWQGLWVTLISELAPPDASATAVGVAMVFSSVGIVIWPPLLGLTADLSGSLRWSWVALAVTVVLSLWPLRALGRAARFQPSV